MADRPLLMNGPMVLATLAGLKTQTRRPVKPQPSRDTSLVEWNTSNEAWVPWNWSNGGSYAGGRRTGDPYDCPFGLVGDRLYVRETWGVHPAFNQVSTRDLIPGGFGRGFYVRGENPNHTHGPVVYGADYLGPPQRHAWEGGKWRPSMHLPKWASRLWLRVTGLRVERVRSISDADVRAEGVPAAEIDKWRQWLHADDVHGHAFGALWDSIYAAQGLGWDANPWTWVVEFERVTP